ncbi:MAG: hypothetical protein ABR501_05365 [Pyrinomonadaceae bacterium]
MKADEDYGVQSVAKSRNLITLFLISLLAVISYIPALRQPLIEDDYPNIRLARTYGRLTGWPRMAQDDINRVRATTFVLTHWIERSFGLQPAAFYGFSILLHMVNCLLLYALGRWEAIGFRVSAWSAGFFAIYEGHQEAVMWYSACNELLLFLFVMLSLVSWLIFLEQKRHRWMWYVTAILFFILALLSKESSVILIPLLALPLLLPEIKLRSLLFLLPFAVVGIIYGALIFQTHNHSFRFHDQSFELSAPFWETWTKSFFALLWPWGWFAVTALFVWRAAPRLLVLAAAWVSISFVPYIFVSYVHRVPSRQTYLASAGLALLVGAALVALRDRINPARVWMSVLLVAIVLFHNVTYLWTRKHKQFLKRAEPTEQLIAFTRNHNGVIYVRCFPRPAIIGDAAVEVMLGKPSGTLIWDYGEAQRLNTAATFCYQPE